MAIPWEWWGLRRPPLLSWSGEQWWAFCPVVPLLPSGWRGLSCLVSLRRQTAHFSSACAGDGLDGSHQRGFFLITTWQRWSIKQQELRGLMPQLFWLSERLEQSGVLMCIPTLQGCIWPAEEMWLKGGGCSDRPAYLALFNRTKIYCCIGLMAFESDLL